MDYSEFYTTIRTMILAHGIDARSIDRKETLYYDESGNIKHLIVKGDKLNAQEDLVFVLGGVEASTNISADSLKDYFGKSHRTELKSTKSLKGNFIEILRKDTTRKTLQLLIDNGWHIHFHAVQVLYYGFVDIIDSIEEAQQSPIELKAELYKVLKKDPAKTLALFKQYKYPNIKPDQVESFLSELLRMIDSVMEDDEAQLRINIGLSALRILIERAKKQTTLPFIQDETPHEWVSNFSQFYIHEILSMYKKDLIFDKEVQIMKLLKSEKIMINGKIVDNYRFVESASDSMIQISDYIASILRKYFMDHRKK